MKLAWLVILNVACSSNTTDPPRHEDRELDCDDTVTDMLRSSQLAMKPVRDPRTALVEACQRDRWPRAVRTCFAEAQTSKAQLACAAQMSPEQQAGFEAAIMAAYGRNAKPAGKLAVTSVSPANGDVDGGTYVVLKGERFIADGPRNAKVYFGSRQGTVVRFASDRELIVQAPTGRDGEAVDVVVVFDPGGTMRLDRAFTFVKKP